MLQRVSIQNFKSLKDVTLDLQKVNLLIGPNNSGKTNFLKALGDIIAIPFSTVADSLTNRSTFKDVSFKRSEEPINFIVVFDNNEGYALSYNLQLQNTGLRDVTKEFFYFNIKSLDVLSIIDFSNYKTEITEELHSLIKSLHKTKIFQPNPLIMTGYQPILNGYELLPDVSNVVAYLEYLRDERTEYFESLQDDLSQYLNEFTGIRFKTEHSAQKETLKQLCLKDKYSDTLFTSDEVSEGVLYFIALLCIVYQPNPPKLLLLEEPERGIHPRRIHEVMNFIFQLAEEKDVQIILTSHNENVLNYFSNRPESVFVFDKNEEGATQVRNLKRDIIEPSHERSRQNGLPEIDYTSELGENWMYGILGGVPEDAL